MLVSHPWSYPGEHWHGMPRWKPSLGTRRCSCWAAGGQGVERLSLWSLVSVLPEGKDYEAPWSVQTITSHFPLLKKTKTALRLIFAISVSPSLLAPTDPLPNFLQAGQEGLRFMRESMEEASVMEAGG